MTLTVGSLFAGIGGFDLAAEWMGWRTIWVSEIDPYGCEVLRERFPDAANLGDLTRIDWSRVTSPDILCGGFPCQDISSAGKRAGIGGERSGLWKEYARAIRELRPRYVVVENVRALLVRGVDVVLGDLAALGYDAEWEVLSAADVGAPHLRERLWIVAYPCRCGDEMADAARLLEGRPIKRAERERAGAGGESRPVPDAEKFAERSGLRAGASRRVGERRLGDVHCALPDASGERSQGKREGRPATRPADGSGDGRYSCGWESEPDVGRVAHGVSARVDRLRGLGNAIVPQCAVEGPFRRIVELERMVSA